MHIGNSLTTSRECKRPTKVSTHFGRKLICAALCLGELNRKYAHTDELLSDDANDAFIESVMLPPPELGNLPDIENMIRQANTSAESRNSLGKFLIADDYIKKLIPLLSVAEDLESLSDLHRLCNITKMIILLNDTVIIEHIVTDEVILGIVGMLECICHRTTSISG